MLTSKRRIGVIPGECIEAEGSRDPAFFLIADPDPGFDDQKFKKIYS
jgi:hypothetical protein